MQSSERLNERLQGLDGQDYGAYQALRGIWRFPQFELNIARIPKDPYAPPHTGIYRVSVPRGQAGFPAAMTESRTKAVALRDFLARRIHGQCAAFSQVSRGTGNSGLIAIAEPGQEILERSSVVIDDNIVEARMFVGLPAKGRAINSKLAALMLMEELPRIVGSSLFYAELDHEALQRHLCTAEDSHWLREQLPSRGLVAFIADGAILPRASGVEATPMEVVSALRFESPERLRVRFDLPNAGPVSGLGIPAGVTLIVGGGFHGKSTLLQALELGIYDHIPGDGRELCVSHPESVKIRATNGRSVVKTDISAFITNVPREKATTSFSTANASGSTSQAAFIAEAMEAGAAVLLMDEDTCATNFMVRDKRMQELVAKAHEPITAYVDRVQQLYEQLGISTVLVMGGSGDYFSAAGCVIQMKEFEPHDVTGRAHQVADRFPTERTQEGSDSLLQPGARYPLGEELDPKNAYGHFRITAQQVHQLTYGANDVGLSDLEQLVEASQTRAIGRAILHARQYMNGRNSLRQVADMLMEDLQRGGLDALDPDCSGNLARFRSLDFAAVLNRFRTLRVNRNQA